MSKYRPVSKLLTTSDGNLQSLLERAQYLQTLTRTLREALDPGLAEHITLANLRNETAIVTADSPVWLARIRYLAPSILHTLRQQPGLSTLTKIQFKVQPPCESTPSSHEIRHATLSSASSAVLESAAAGIEDSELADSLRRLSRQGKQPDDS